MKSANGQQLITESVLTDDTCQTRDPAAANNPVSLMSPPPFQFTTQPKVLHYGFPSCLLWFKWLKKILCRLELFFHKCHVSFVFLVYILGTSPSSSRVNWPPPRSIICLSPRCLDGSSDICRYAVFSFPTPWIACKLKRLIILDSVRRTATAMKIANPSTVPSSKRLSYTVGTAAMFGTCGEL